MRTLPSLAATLLAALLSAPPSVRAADVQTEQLIGGIEALLFVCSPIDPKSAKAAQEMLDRTVAQHKVNLVAIRKTDGYQSIYNPEVNRMLALPKPSRLATCQSAL
jgi:hypothetical protein